MLDTNLVSHLKTKWEIILNQPFLCHLHFHTILQFTVVLISNRTSRQIISHTQNTIKISSCTDGKIATVFLSHRKNQKKVLFGTSSLLQFNTKTDRPSPDVAIIPESVCSFRVTVERHLKSRSLLPVRFCFSGMFFVSCLLVRECRGRDGNFLKKMISVLFIFLLSEIPVWILMAKE